MLFCRLEWKISLGNGDFLSLLDLIDELGVFVKDPIKTVHEVLLDLNEKGEVDGGQAFDSVMITLWAALS